MFLYNYDYIFDGYQIIKSKKIGSTFLLYDTSVIQHLLFCTDSDTSHINHFIQYLLANNTKYTFIRFNFIKTSKLENIQNKLSINMNFLFINYIYDPSLCIMIPTFKRNYFPESFNSFSKQTYKSKFHIFIQNDEYI